MGVSDETTCEPPARRGPWRTVVAVLALTIAGVALPLTALRLVGAGRSFPLAAALTVYPYVLAVTAAGAVLAAVAGLRTVAAVLALTVTVGLLASAPRVLPSAQPAVDGPTLTVAVANLREGRADADALVALVVERSVDVLVAPELTPDAITRLEVAGLGAVLPHAVTRPSTRTSGAGIFSRHPLTRGPDSTRGGFGATPSARVDVPHAPPVDLRGVHPLPPISAAWTAAWRDALAAVPGPEDGPVLRIVAGDLNASHDHGPFRDLLRAGYVDAAAARGQAWRPTFSAPDERPPVPPVTLDHVLVDPRVAVERVTTHPLPGSDHRAVVARLRLPAA